MRAFRKNRRQNALKWFTVAIVSTFHITSQLHLSHFVRIFGIYNPIPWLKFWPTRPTSIKLHISVQSFVLFSFHLISSLAGTHDSNFNDQPAVPLIHLNSLVHTDILCTYSILVSLEGMSLTNDTLIASSWSLTWKQKLWDIKFFSLGLSPIDQSLISSFSWAHSLPMGGVSNLHTVCFLLSATSSENPRQKAIKTIPLKLALFLAIHYQQRKAIIEYNVREININKYFGFVIYHC